MTRSQTKVIASERPEEGMNLAASWKDPCDLSGGSGGGDKGCSRGGSRRYILEVESAFTCLQDCSASRLLGTVSGRLSESAGECTSFPQSDREKSVAPVPCTEAS